MVLIRKLVLHGMIHNVKVRAVYLRSIDNKIADSLSRFQKQCFLKEIKKQKWCMDDLPTPVPASIWPVTKIWLK